LETGTASLRICEGAHERQESTMSMSQPDASSRIAQLNDRAVQRLVAAHAARTDEPLVLAVRYRSSEEDVYLLEVIENFPGEDDDELLATEFEPSAELLTVGHLRLLLGSPGQLRAAVRRGDPEVEAVKTGSIVHSNRSATARELRQLLGL
jgi:hypothetical protein